MRPTDRMWPWAGAGGLDRAVQVIWLAMSDLLTRAVRDASADRAAARCAARPRGPSVVPTNWSNPQFLPLSGPPPGVRPVGRYGVGPAAPWARRRRRDGRSVRSRGRD